MKMVRRIATSRAAARLLLAAASLCVLCADTYYVDCASGNAAADGRSTATAWKTLTPVNSRTFTPGESILLRRGTRCAGPLAPRGSGTATAPITAGAYGTGAAPVVDGGSYQSAVRLYNQQGWHIENIETTGGVLYGIYVAGDQGPLTHFRVTNVAVHDVRGPLTTKQSGLVIFNALGNATLNDIVIDGVTAWNSTQWAGIEVLGGPYTGSMETPHGTGVTIRNSIVHDVWGDGIVLFIVQDGLIERSAAWRTGQQPTQTIGTPGAIWTWMCNDCTVRFNESRLSWSPAVDGGAFDIDWGNRNGLVEYNYGHQSKSYCASVFGAGWLTTQASIIRDNLCVANSQQAKADMDFIVVTWDGGRIRDFSIDHNVSCMNPQVASPALSTTLAGEWLQILGQNRFHDQLVYTTKSLLLDTASPIDLDNNSYWYTGTGTPAFKYDGKSYAGFGAYQAGSGQDAHSSYAAPAAAADQPGGSLPAGVLAAHRGKALLLSFLDSSEDALGQLVVLRSLADQYAGQAVAWRIAGTIPAEWPLDAVSLLSGTPPSNELDVQRLPATFLIDAQGRIVKRWEGYSPSLVLAPPIERLLGIEQVPGCPAERAIRTPALADSAVTNLASGAGGPIAPGELVRISGLNFGWERRAAAALAPGGALAKDLAQAQVYFGALSAPVVSVANGQIVAQVPYALSPGNVRVQVQYKGRNSNAVLTAVADAAPGVVRAAGKQALVLNPNGRLNGAGAPASAGQLIRFFATGAGATAPASVDGALALNDAAAPVGTLKALFGGVAGSVEMLSQVYPGMWQVGARVPDGAPLGDAVELALQVGGIASPPGATLVLR